VNPGADHEQYLRFMNKFLRGEPPSEDEYLQHFVHQNGLPEAMLEIGDVAPDLGLPDQSGRVRHLADLHGERGLILVFVRSTYWCPYCRNQLADLHLRIDATRRSGFEVAVVTSDEAERIAQFTTHHQLDYPILSDTDGRVIDAYGVRNANIPPNELQGHRPLPHPGAFLISPDDVIRSREFTGDIRHRVSTSAIVAEHSTTDDAPSSAVHCDADGVAASVWLSADRVHGGQEIGFAVRLRPDPHVHIYGHATQRPYTPLSVTVESTDRLLDEVRVSYPEATSTELDALGEVLPVHSGDVEIRGRLRLRWSPPQSPFAELADFVRSYAIPPGEYTLDVDVTYQACAGDVCLMPHTMHIPVPVTVVPNAAAGATVRLGATVIPPPDDQL
jgi:peroxiredoxin